MSPSEHHNTDFVNIASYLNQAAKAYAFLQGRGYVTPQDVKTIGPDILRHRILLSYEAEADEMTPDDAVARFFEHIEVP